MSERISGKVIIVNGCPASGKTYTANLLSKKLSIPVISKDFFKESLFDSLGFEDRQFSAKIGKASYKLLLKTAKLLAQQKYSFILENAFFSKSEDEVLSSLNYHKIIQIWCHTPVEMLIERFVERALDGSRHPGHADSNNVKEIEQKILSNTYAPLKLPAPLIYLPTSDFNRSNYINAFNSVIQEYAKPRSLIE